MENPFLHSLTSGFICYFLLSYTEGGGEENDYRCADAPARMRGEAITPIFST